MLGGTGQAIKKNVEALVIARKEIELEVNADKYRYVVMSPDQNAGRSHSMKTDNSSFIRAKEFKLFGKVLIYQNSLQEEIKSRYK
jgi:hypothetical protein